jgi:hypothetical protein
MKRSLNVFGLCAAVACVGACAVSAGAATDVPAIPNLPSGFTADDTARFKIKVRGFQSDRTSFFRAPVGDGCNFHVEGTLNESWQFERKSGVIMEFSKIGGRVFVKRAKRQFGDSAFQTKSELERTATGFRKVKLPPDQCITTPLPTATCGIKKKLSHDLRLGVSAGKLSLESSGPALGAVNPLEKCGIGPDGGNFNYMSAYFPTLSKQKGELRSQEIFGSNKHFNVYLKDHQLKNADDDGLTTLNENFSGETTVTFTRVK